MALEGHGTENHHRGLIFDLQTLLDRRRALQMFAGLGLLTIAGCGSDGATANSTSAGSATVSSAGGAAAAGGSTSTGPSTGCEEIPGETAGPFPGDGSNGPNVLTSSGIVRSDIRSSFGASATRAVGVPLTISLTLLDSANDCAILSGAAVYLWHCDIDGKYSLYSDGVTGENYLRGVQATNQDGVVTFRSIYPAAYSGRWPHIHFEVYAGLGQATAAGRISATSQIALPQGTCEQVYATAGYAESLGNLSRTSLQDDNVFGDDGGVSQLADVTGTIEQGFVATLVVVI